MSKIDDLQAEIKDLREVLGSVAGQMDDAVRRLAQRAVADALAQQNRPQDGKKGASD